MADPRLSRRALLTAAGVGGAALVAGGGVVAGRELTSDSDESDNTRVPFRGPQQAGMATPAQDRLHFASFDVVTDSRDELREMLRAWTTAAARMTAGAPAGPVNDNPDAPPDDTGEALGLPPSRLTVTIGFGPTLFTLDGNDRFGLARRQPKALVELPAFADDTLDPDRSGGDICVQACADDPQVAFHAVRNLTRIGRGAVVMRWSQLGFGRTSSTTRSQETPRNLMGFKDGTNNVKAEDTEELAKHVWVSAAQPAWLQGGTYLVARRIRMLIETWDRASLLDQELTIGRVKDSGAPLGAHAEFDKVDLGAKADDGAPVIPVDAHIRLAAPSENDGIRILRRGYSFTDGMDERLGQLDAGLFFIAFVRDPDAFIKLQHRLGRNDALNEYITHNGSALFAVPPGVQPGGYVGEGLFA
jgi:deferrochelatase/peroxidase EfeB